MTNLKDWQDSLLEHQELTSNSKFVGLVISRYLGKSGLIFPSLQTISELTSNTILTVRKSINNLQLEGFIKVEKERITKQGGYKNSYKLYLHGEQVLKNNTINNTNNNNINDILTNMSNDMLNNILTNILKNNKEVYEYILSYLNKEKCNKNKENAKKRWDANECERIETDANDANKIKENKIKENKNYKYKGSVIKLSEKDYNIWKETFSNLDLEVELYARDVWLDNADDKAKKNWFVSTSSFFAKKNGEVKLREDGSTKFWLPEDF